MVLPLIVAGVMAAGAIAQYLNSQNGLKLAKEERKKLEELASKLQQPQFDENGVPTPAFDMSDITPEEYKVVSQYVPQAANYIAEKNPTLVEKTADMDTGRQAQLNALKRLSGIADQRTDPAMMQAMNEASRRSQMEAQSREQSALQDAQRRGMFGSGLAMAMGEQSAQQAMEGGAERSQQAAADAYKNRLQALMQSADLGGQINQQDYNMQSRNADIINQFNARQASSQRDFENQRVNTANEAALYNQKNAQDIGNMNVQQRNKALVDNLTRKNALRQQAYQDTYQNWNAKNALQQQKYSNDLSKYGLAAGLNADARNDIAQQTAANANMIQGLTNAGAAMGGYYGAQNSADQDYERQMNRAYFNKYGKMPKQGWMDQQGEE